MWMIGSREAGTRLAEAGDRCTWGTQGDYHSQGDKA